MEDQRLMKAVILEMAQRDGSRETAARPMITIIGLADVSQQNGAAPILLARTSLSDD